MDIYEIIGLGIVGGAIGVVWQKKALRRNRKETKADDNCIILTNFSYSKIGPLSYPSLAEIACIDNCTRLGITVQRIVRGAGFKDISDAVNDRDYSSIAVVGMDGGMGRGNWNSRDGVVTARRLKEELKGRKKTGHGIHYLAADIEHIPEKCMQQMLLDQEESRRLGYDSTPLLHHVINDPNKILGFEGRVSKLHLYSKEITVIGKSQQTEPC